VLGYGQGSQCSIKSSSRKGDKRLLQQELEVHLPYARHLVQQDQGPFEQGIDFSVLGDKDGSIELRDMFRTESQVLLSVSRSG
jgi:hypothetical protein